ncbi:ATP-binding protein [Coraliomargarita sp. SDUM461004]|uniref:histidine kinase n=1 Tax=Thalassobacterium sedimentorum TaxID=3041258 RepID=A0ABU1AL75_9BACT|nr:ATP-binding protein [Coraliomargarita sp. SDUM461004]MDQ8195424.1 ATP-binding protein [Coraliomargarita sp. SDUM461004]
MKFKFWIHRSTLPLHLPSKLAIFWAIAIASNQLILATLFAQPAPLANLLSTAHTPDQHGGGPMSSSIAEDVDGSVFVANESGLLKYDGAHWHSMPPTGQTDYISSVAIDSQNRIWISSLTTIGYYYLDPQGHYRYTDLTHTIQQQLNSPDLGTFWTIYAQQDKIYLITTESVLRWDGQQWKHWHFDIERRILTDWVEGQLYLHNRGTGLFRLDGDVFTLIAPETAAVASGIISIIEKSESGLLCATVANGFHRLKNDTFTPSNIEWQASKILNAQRLQNETIAVSTTHDGIKIIDPSTGLIGQVRHDNSSVYDILEHSSGAIWAATTSTIIEIPNSALSHFPDKALDIIQHQNELYYTNEKAVKKIHQSRGAMWSPRTIVQGDAIWNLYSASVDLLYGDAQNLGVITSGKQNYTIPSSRHVGYLFESNLNPSLIYTSDPPKVSRWQHSETGWQYLDSLQNFNYSVLSITELPNEKLLISCENSPILLVDWQSQSTLTKLGQSQGLLDKFVWAYSLRDDQTILVITNKGLFTYAIDTGQFQYDPILGNDLGTDAYALETCREASGDGWIVNLPATGKRHQIGHLKVNVDKSLSWSPLQLPSLNEAGKVTSLFHEKRSEGQAALWVGGTSKLLRYNLTKLSSAPAPTTRLVSVAEQEDSKVYYNGNGSLKKEPLLDYPQKALVVNFVAPPTRLQVKGYQTRLLGFHETWTQPSPTTYREFTNLPHGHYTFQVRAIDEFGRNGNITEYRFTIRRPWYLTAYAYVGYALSAIAILVFSNHWRNRTLRIRNEQLEALVNTRTYELETQKLQLIKANRAKQNFLASMSHEIRNPLNGIIGIARLLKQKEQEQGIQTEETTHLYSCSQHLNQLLSQTLDYSSLEAGKLRTRFESFNPCELMQEVIQIQNGMAQEKGILLQLDVPKVQHNWKGDPVLLRQILINLVSNGIKYTKEGSVSLRLSSQEIDESVKACFEVVDTGPGVPEGQEVFIFEEFARLPESQTSHIPGTGLGLTISSQMARLMGGQLTLDPDYTGGARFLLTLQFELELFRRKTRANPEQVQSEILKGQRVLIADDMSFNRYISAAVLNSMGAKIDIAENGRIALNMLRKTHYEIVILDINMPEMSGLEVVENYLKAPHTPPPIFIALSAYNSLDAEDKCLGAGFKHFIEKPLDPEKLKKLLKFHPQNTRADTKSDLLAYLSQNGPISLQELKAEYTQTFREELAKLKAAFAAQDLKAQETITHKLLGLCRVQQCESIQTLVENISTKSKQRAPIETITPLIEQLDVELQN